MSAPINSDVLQYYEELDKTINNEYIYKDQFDLDSNIDESPLLDQNQGVAKYYSPQNLSLIHI